MKFYLEKLNITSIIEGGGVNKLLSFYYRHRKDLLGVKLGFSIPLNVADMGLSIAHIGPIIINSGAHIGRYCRIHVGVNIGTELGFNDHAPIIGNNVFISPGVKVFGSIKIEDDVVIGANAVVNKSILEKNICVAGVPAKKISERGRRNIPQEKELVEEFERIFIR